MAEIEESLFNNKWKIIGIGGLILILLVIFALVVSYIAYRRKKSNYVKLPNSDIQKDESEEDKIIQLRASEKREADALIEKKCINSGKAYDYDALICRDASPETCAESTLKKSYDPETNQCIPDPQGEVEEISIL